MLFIGVANLILILQVQALIFHHIASKKKGVPIDMASNVEYIDSSTAYSGLDKYLGGIATADGNRVFCIPGSAQYVLVIESDDNLGETMPSSAVRITQLKENYPGKFKWLRGVHAPQIRTMYGIPSCHNSILRIKYFEDKSITPELNTIDLPSSLTTEERIKKWKYHGAVYHEPTCRVYCIPCNANQVLEITPNNDGTETVRTIGKSFPGNQKWYGGIIESNTGKIFGIPYCHDEILVIDPSREKADDRVYTIASDLIPKSMGYKWHGGCVNTKDGFIVGIPSHADSILIIDPQTEEVKLLRKSPVPIENGTYRPHNKYKFGGGVASANAVYCFPSDADQVLKVVPTTGEVTSIGPVFQCHNKWQNGK